MRCPKCGNEVDQNEAFCGQCGTPTTLPANPTEMVYSPPPNGLLKPQNTINANMPSPSPAPPNSYGTGMLPPPNAYNSNIPPTPGSSIAPGSPGTRPVGSQQPAGFYQDATEAMSAVPTNNQAGYPPQSFAGTPMQGGYPATGQYAPQAQPFQPGNYTQHSYPQVPPLPSGQAYGYGVQPTFTPPPQKQQSNLAIIIASICLVIALIAVIIFGSMYLLHGHPASKTSITPTPVPTSIPTPTAIPSPSPSPSPTPTDTPTPVPSPTPVPTPAPDPNFTWCNEACTSRGFIVEYPLGWDQGQTSDKTGVQFLKPSQQDIYAAFKVPGGQTNNNASDLVDTDLQTVFSSQTGYVAPTSSSVTTIGGETWTYAIAYFQLNGQKERAEVFATVHLGKGYVIELQAPDSQFETVNTQYFATMIGRFQFQQSTP